MRIFKHILVLILLILGTFLVYKIVYPNPRLWYDHYLYLAKSFLQLRVDVPNIPTYYQDVVHMHGKVFLPFGPIPAVISIPFLLLSPTISQQEISVILGAANVALIFLLLDRFTSKRIASILAIFFAFGTVAFWSSIVGTSWYIAHTTAVLFLTLSLLSHFSKRHFLAGVLFSLAVLSRYPVLPGVLFFLLELRNSRRALAYLLLGAFCLVPVHFGYNWVRFNDFFEMGYKQIYELYTSQGYAYSIINLIAPHLPAFGYLDIRNIPLHLITFLVLPPTVSESFTIQPSPYGMGIVFTSPLLLLALLPNFRKGLERNIFLGALGIAFAEFLHYAQGWVQFGYRFLLDFLPFLMILLALKFKLKPLYIFLLAISIIVNLWGTLWGISLGW